MLASQPAGGCCHNHRLFAYPLPNATGAFSGRFGIYVWDGHPLEFAEPSRHLRMLADSSPESSAKEPSCHTFRSRSPGPTARRAKRVEIHYIAIRSDGTERRLYADRATNLGLYNLLNDELLAQDYRGPKSDPDAVDR